MDSTLLSKAVGCRIVTKGIVEMITRGHFIGQIIDELGTISEKVDLRCGLGLTDLNRHLENFFKEVINLLLGVNLTNLNSERSNHPGIDLGDTRTKLAFQVTSTKTSEKVNATLEKISDDDVSKYDKIRVLIIGKKQGSYTLDESNCARCSFEESNIWDIADVCRRLMDIKIEQLQALWEYVRSEAVRVRIELEIPDEQGQFPTSITSYVEKIATPQIGTCQEYCHFYKVHISDFDQTPEDVQKDLRAFSDCLAKLPRITREFFAVLLERRDGDDPLMIRDDKLRRICKWPDLNGELRLLEAERLAFFNEGDHPNEGATITMHIPGLIEHGREVYGYLYIDLIQYIELKKLSYQKVITNMDFSDF